MNLASGDGLLHLLSTVPRPENPFSGEFCTLRDLNKNRQSDFYRIAEVGTVCCQDGTGPSVSELLWTKISWCRCPVGREGLWSDP